MADDLNDLLDGLEPSSGFVQVGHSAGGPMVLVDPTDEAATQQFGVPFRVGEKIVIAVEWVLARVGLLERWGVTLLVDSRYQEGSTGVDVY